MKVLCLAALIVSVIGRVVPGDDADPQTVLTEASTLARQGRYEEALQRQIWFHDNALRLQPSMTGVRLSFALSSWVELGKKYPKALATLVEIRDKDLAAFEGDGGSVDLFSDVNSIDNYLGDIPTTIELFRKLDARNPKLAESCFIFGEQTLAEAGEYQLCSKYIPQPEVNFQYIRSAYEMMEVMNRTQKADPRRLKSNETSFETRTCRLITILVVANRRPEAEIIQSKAIAVRDSVAVRTAIELAESKGKPKG